MNRLRAILVAVLLAGLVWAIPAPAFAWSRSTLNGYTVYVMDPAPSAYQIPNTGVWSSNLSIGMDLLGGDSETREVLAITAGSMIGRNGSTTWNSGVGYAKVCWYTTGGYDAISREARSPTTIPDGGTWVGIARIYQAASTTHVGQMLGQTAGSDTGLQVAFNSTWLNKTLTASPMSTQYAISPTAPPTTRGIDDLSGARFGDSILAIKRVGSTYYWTKFTGLMQTWDNTASGSTVTTGSTTSWSGGGAASIARAAAGLTFYHFNGSGVWSENDGASTIQSSIFLSAAESTDTAVYDLVTRNVQSYATSSTAWATQRQDEHDSQDQYYQGIDDSMPIPIHNTDVPGSPSDPSEDASGWASNLENGAIGTALNGIWGRITGWLSGLSGLFWFIPFFTDNFSGW